MKKLNLKNFQVTRLTKEPVGEVTEGVLSKAVKALFDDWKKDRTDLEKEWVECWAQFLSNVRGAEVIRIQARETVGDVQTDYRHKLPTGKALELVETVNSYMQAAFFPNKEWFDLYPVTLVPTPDWEERIDVIKKFILHKLRQSNFEDLWDIFIRQLLILGTSVMALPWKRQYKQTFKNIQGKPMPVNKKVFDGLDLQVVDLFDFFIDPTSPPNTDCTVIRRVRTTKGNILRLIEDGVFVGDSDVVMRQENSNDTREGEEADLAWMKGAPTPKTTDKVELLDFWGNLELDDIELIDVHIVVMGDVCLMCEQNPFWSGKPFVVGTLINVQDSPYGIGLLQPVLGQLHQLFISGNHRLDIAEFIVNPMLLVNNDGDLDISQIWSEPGKIIPVSDLDNAIRPLELGGEKLMITVNDENLLEQRIDKTTGVGAYVGVNSGRQAERVTAEEVLAQRDAGGNRLGRYHSHVEKTAFTAFLSKCYAYIQQFMNEPEVVRLQKPEQRSMSDRFDYFEVTPEDVQMEVDIVPVGSEHLLDKEFELKQRLDFLGFVMQYQQLAQFLNLKEIMKDLARRFTKSEWEKFVSIPETPEVQAPLAVESASLPVAQAPEQPTNSQISQVMLDNPQAALQATKQAVQNQDVING